MAKEVVYQVNGYRIAAGQTLPTWEVPAGKLAGATVAVLTIAVDDPAAEPPTAAGVEGTVEASADGGASWSTVATLWAGTCGILGGTVPVADRRIRVRAHADLAATLSLLVEVA